MKTQQQIIDYIRAHPGIPMKRIRANLWRHHIPAHELNDAFNVARGNAPTPAQSPKPSEKGTGQPVSLLMDQFDDVKKVRQAMRDMPQDHYEEDDVLRRRLHVGIDRWRAVCAHPDVSEFRYTLPNKRTVWMHKKAQCALTEKIRMDGVVS